MFDNTRILRHSAVAKYKKRPLLYINYYNMKLVELNLLNNSVI